MLRKLYHKICKTPESFLANTHILEHHMATIADAIIAIQADLAAVKTAVAALPTSAGDSTAVLAAVANVQTSVDAVKTELTPTPVAPAA